jgi:3-phenylpropionate/trans-cinnamate dioxygenase ferredoxin reductase component
MTAPRTVLVIGTGVAGVSCAAGLRAEGFDGQVVLVGDEPELPYRRPPLSKDVLRGEKTGDDVRLKPGAWYEAHDVELLTGTAAESVDPSARTATLADGGTLTWDALVLATGGRPRHLPAAEGVEGVLTLRGLADLPALQAALLPGRHVAVVGAGFVGAEVAASARALGCDVTVLEAAPVPLGRLLPPAVASVYADLHRRNGVDLRLGAGVASVHRAGHGVVVGTSDGQRVAADALLVAVGMVPNTGLAERAGLPVADGVLVDSTGATAAPGVWAAGDVACGPDGRTGLPRRQEHWSAAQSSGTAVARAVLGRPRAVPEVPWCWSDQYGVNLQVCGWPQPDDELLVRGDLDALDGTVVLARDGRLTGAITLGRPREARALRALLAKAPGTPLAALADADLSALAAA